MNAPYKVCFIFEGQPRYIKAYMQDDALRLARNWSRDSRVTGDVTIRYAGKVLEALPK